MFALFRKKVGEPSITDKVTISEIAKLKAMHLYWESDRNSAFIFWFDESLRKAESYFAGQPTAPVTLLNYKEANSYSLSGKNPVFAEHYPLRRKEEELFKKLNVKSIIIFSSLEEPLLKHFGGEKIINIMKQLGIKENEVIEHRMISKAILHAQNKIEKKVLIDQFANAQDDWFKKNFSA